MSSENNTPKVAKRTRRVTSEITLPKDGSLVGTITLNIVGAEPIVYEANFGAFSDEFVQQAALAGLTTRLSIAYSGKTDPADIVKAIEAEIENFNNNKFISRYTMERKVNAPDIVVAWILAKEQDPNDREVLAQHMDSWSSRTDEQKYAIQNNLKVAIKLEELQAARRLARKAKEATADDVLAI